MKPITNRHYDDIIDLPRHVSPRRPQMSLLGRAAQFAPFAALTGFEDTIDETARLTDRCVELDEEDLFHLNEQLCGLIAAIAEQPEITLTYFVPDEKKSGGAYCSVTGRVRRIDEVNQNVIFADGTVIPFGRIQHIEASSLAG